MQSKKKVLGVLNGSFFSNLVGGGFLKKVWETIGQTKYKNLKNLFRVAKKPGNLKFDNLGKLKLEKVEI